MVRVAVDATPLAGDRTGIGVAVDGMIRSLAGRPGIELIGYALTGAGRRVVASRLPAGVRAARGPMPASLLMRVWGSISFPPAELWTGRVDVVHGTNFVVPPTLRAARLVTVWDLTAVHFPELCTPTSRRYPQLVRRAIDGGAWVHTGSGYVAQEIVEHFGADPARVIVIPPGVDIPSPRPEHSGSPPYILALGTTEPRKDFVGLVNAFDIVAGGHAGIELWIAGPEGWGGTHLDDAVRGSRHGQRIRRLGWLADVGDVLSGAALLAYPSLYEGFGFPPLEAMAAGVPVVATAAGSVPEVAGDAALLVPPGEPQKLAEAISRVLDDGALRAGLVERGAKRAREFSWDASAAAMHDAYNVIAGVGV